MNVNVGGVSTKDKWRGLMKRTLSTVHKKKTLPQEWQKYSDSQISLLLELQNPNSTYDSIKQTFDILAIFQNSSAEFLELCLSTCFDSSPFIDKNEKFLSLHIQVDNWICEGFLTSLSQESMHLSVLLHLIESENIEALRTMLAIKHDSS